MADTRDEEKRSLGGVITAALVASLLQPWWRHYCSLAGVIIASLVVASLLQLGGIIIAAWWHHYCSLGGIITALETSLLQPW